MYTSSCSFKFIDIKTSDAMKNPYYLNRIIIIKIIKYKQLVHIIAVLKNLHVHACTSTSMNTSTCTSIYISENIKQ